MPYLGPKPVNVRSASSLIVDGNLTAGETALENGLTVDKDGNTVATFDRATSDGAVVDIQKSGTTVGSIGTLANLAYFGNSGANSNGVIFTSAGIEPFDSSNGASTKDGDIDLGASNQRFQDLYLSGGVYLGGTGAANQLDDYEEGSWTPVVRVGSANGTVVTTTINSSTYTKIGNLVFVNPGITRNDATAHSGDLHITNLPFTSKGGTQNPIGSVWLDNASGDVSGMVYIGGSTVNTIVKDVGNTDSRVNVNEFDNGRSMYYTLIYQT